MKNLNANNFTKWAGFSLLTIFTLVALYILMSMLVDQGYSTTHPLRSETFGLDIAYKSAFNSIKQLLSIF